MFKHFSPRARTLCALSLSLCLTAGSVFAVPAQPTDPAQFAPMSDSQPPQSGQPQLNLYLRYAPRLLELGYSQKEVDALFSAIPPVRCAVLLRYAYTPLAVEYAGQSHFRSALLERYLRYGQANPGLSAGQVVTQVNIGLDRSHYSGVAFVRTPNSSDVLVNKYHYLGSTFVPELVRMGSSYANYSSAYLEPTAYEWFTRMVDDARKEGLQLYCVSAYRSYSYQSTLYQRYVRQDGRELADTYSARPGYSEHQTGLAVDINTASRSSHFENTAQYQWLAENSWKYGFILRYPQDKEDITGFTFEPWHYRYVGQELAKAVYESGLTYDEYVASQPSGETRAATALSFRGKDCALSRTPLLLDGTYYLAVSDLAAALGLSCGQDGEGTVVLTSASTALTLSRDQAQCTLNESVYSLSCAPFAQGGDLFVPLEETARLLGLTLLEKDQTLILTLAAPSGPASSL